MFALKKSVVADDDLHPIEDALYNLVLQTSSQNDNLNLDQGAPLSGQDIIDQWLGLTGDGSTKHKGSKDVKQLIKTGIEIDERIAGAISHDNFDASQETLSFPLQIKQSLLEQDEIQATIRNQGLFNYGERPSLYLVIHLMSLKFQSKSSRNQSTTLHLEVTPEGHEQLKRADGDA